MSSFPPGLFFASLTIHRFYCILRLITFLVNRYIIDGDDRWSGMAKPMEVHKIITEDDEDEQWNIRQRWALRLPVTMVHMRKERPITP